MKPNDPAYPLHEAMRHAETTEQAQQVAGLTKREYLAAMAMQGTMANGGVPTDGTDQVNIAKYCVQMVDALIEELNKND